MTKTILDIDSDLSLTNAIPHHDLRHWWDIRQADPDSVIAFTDESPRHFIELVDRIRSGAYRFYMAYQEARVAGAMWLHDIVYGSHGMPCAGWLGTYVLPERRGVSTTRQMWEQMHEVLAQIGRAHV